MHFREAMPPHVPVAFGSATSEVHEVGPFRITRAAFGAGESLAPHTHDRPCIAVMLGGSFELRFTAGRCFECLPGSVSIEPPEARHGNCMGQAGARVLVVQPDPAYPLYSRSVGSVLDEPGQLRHAGLVLIARRMDAELRRPDQISPLMLEGLSFELLSHVAREGVAPDKARAPRWLDRATSMLHARFAEGITIAGIAGEVGVHPTHLARTFRRTYHASIGLYVRRLRLDWAAAQLSSTDRSIATIAIEAGFGDQSHFTRRFKEHVGATPNSWRRAHRQSRPAPGDSTTR